MAGPHGINITEISGDVPDAKTYQNKSLPGYPDYLVEGNCFSALIDHL